MSQSRTHESHQWWAELRHEGLLLDASRLRTFPEFAPALSAWQAMHLRRPLVSFQASSGDTSACTALASMLLEEICGLDHKCGGSWQRGNSVPPALTHRSVTGENVRPHHVFSTGGAVRLPVFLTGDSRLGIGQGKRSAARVLEWMRAKDHRLALLSNGHQWRILYARGDSSAWCESDSSQWFVEGEPGPQLDALRLLLSPAALLPESADGTPALLAAIEASRRGQAELSAELGENVRRAVEKVIAAHGPAFLAMQEPPPRQDIYVAACRIVLRLVFTLFAEARNLLPRSEPVYWQSYSLGGLLDQLLRAGAGSGRERLRHRFSAWPRLLALGSLVHQGCEHDALDLRAYGGELFAPGNPAGADGVGRALHVFESACLDESLGSEQIMPDSVVLEVLSLITRTRAVIRQGRGRTTISVPVDFSDLSSEYIGILYEGLLDYELRCVSEDEAAVLFLAIGHEPALPLSRLEQMKDEDLKALVEAFRKAAKAPAGEGEEEAEEEDQTGDEPGPEDLSDSPDSADSSDPAEAPAEDDPPPGDPAAVQNLREAARARAIGWAKRAVVAGGLMPKPKKARKNAPATDDYDHRLADTARRFISRLLLPGEWYLVRWGGTRKGSGSFYTRPGLAGPTIRRTLQPLAWTTSARGEPVPRPPEHILSLKVCDPACGSGTFPVGAARYLAEALFHSVFHHHWLVFATERQPDGSSRDVIRPGAAIQHCPPEAISPLLALLMGEVRLRSIEDESRLRAWLQRLVVENCLYGVDLDPLAIELARLALWVETMDSRLPFTFLDHKFRCGNGLVGAWLDTFQHYPVMAWHREGGDKNHTNFHHHFREKSGKKGTVKVGDVWTEAIRTRLDEVIRPAMRSWIEESTENTFALLTGFLEPDHLLDSAMEAFAGIHALLEHPEQQRAAFQQWLASPPYQNLRRALDLWCALWFWPADRLAAAPAPQNFSQPTAEALAIVEELHRAHRFFHWELEFPDVFGSGTRETPGGFHALLGNPPWEIQKPNSKEFFSNHDPLYRTYGKQAAITKQSELFAGNIAVEHEWLGYNARLKGLGHFTKHAAFPFGDPQDHDNDAFHFTLVPRRAADDAALHARWRPKRKSLASFADPAHPFRYQGSADINTYKLFTEQAHALLRTGGRLGFIVPSGLYSDKGSANLRTLFLNHCRWEWCFGFENREGIFDIHRSFKFIALIVEKGGSTTAVRTAFMRRAVEDWDQHAEAVALDYPRALVTKLSPYSTALVEIRDPRDVAILDRMYSRGVLLGDQSERGWGLKYGTEFHMTNDSKLFPPLPKWEAQGYRPDEYGHWLKGDWREPREFGLPNGLPTLLSHDRSATVTDRPGIILSRDGCHAIRIQDIENMALPLYQGVMMNQFDPSAANWVSGTGLNAKWEDIPWEAKYFSPQFLMGIEHLGGTRSIRRPQEKTIFRSIARTTDQRTMIAATVPAMPCGNACAVLSSSRAGVSLTAALDSFCFDYQIRARVSGTNLNYFFLAETSLPTISHQQTLSLIGASLGGGMPVFARLWKSLKVHLPTCETWESNWALTPHERLRLRCILDAVVANCFGLSTDQFSWSLRDCDHPTSEANSNDFTSRLDPKGFWRVDKEKDPELRHTVLAQVAYADLVTQGLEAFMTGPNGNGWQIPETLRLADYNLGHDNRAFEHQPVVPRLGPRFLEWQLAKDPDQSWLECEAHSHQLDALWTRDESPMTKLSAQDKDDPLEHHNSIRTQLELF